MFLPAAPKFKKIIEDKNAAAQEMGLEALLTWIDRAENPTKCGLFHLFAPSLGSASS
jgi:hypothetical protein